MRKAHGFDETSACETSALRLTVDLLCVSTCELRRFARASCSSGMVFNLVCVCFAYCVDAMKQSLGHFPKP